MEIHATFPTEPFALTKDIADIHSNSSVNTLKETTQGYLVDVMSVHAFSHQYTVQ